MRRDHLARFLERIASGLGDGPASARYDLGEDIRGKTGRISRADVAQALVNELEAGALEGRAVSISD